MKSWQIKAEYNHLLEMKPVKKSGKRLGYASLPARSLGESFIAFQCASCHACALEVTRTRGCATQCWL